MEFDGDVVSEDGVSHKVDQEREETASDISCGQVESAMEVTTEEKEVERNRINYKIDCPMVKSVEVEEVCEVNRDQSESFTERYCHEDIKKMQGFVTVSQRTHTETVSV
jgi:hypothetical protein